MKATVIAIVAALSGFAVGAYWATPGDSLNAVALPPPTTQAAHPVSATAETPTTETPLSVDDTRARLFQILTVTDPVERMRLFTTFLTQVTSANWREAVAAFEAQSNKEGLTFETEWKFLMEHAGKCGGAEAIEQELRKDRDLDAHTMLAGWATENPAAAAAWFERQTGDPKERHLALIAILKGLGRSDPQRGVMLLENAGKLAKDGGDTLIESAIVGGGWRAAEAAFAKILASERLAPEVVDLAVHRMALRRANLGRAEANSAPMLTWVEAHLSRSGNFTYPVIFEAATKDPAGTLAWLSARAEKLKPADIQLFQTQIGEAWQSDGSNQLADWIRRNPETPGHDAIVEGAITACIRQDKMTEAKAFAASIHDEAIRQKWERQLR